MICFLITNDFKQLDKFLLTKKYILVFSKELLLEFIDVANRPKFKRYFPKSDVNKVITLLNEFAIFIDVFTKIEICRDIKDNFLLSLAKDGEVDYLITGDLDLLAISFFEKIKILTFTDFINIK